jgi:hypothetical protein
VQTYKRRGNVAEQHYNDNPTVWTVVERIRLALGTGGMSSDETDTESPESYRQVRRVTKIWVGEELSRMWEAVEKVGMRDPIKTGNTALPRLYLAHTANNRSHPPRGLPSNFYNELWLSSLHANEKDMLGATEPFPVPSPVSLLRWLPLEFPLLTLLRKADILS